MLHENDPITNVNILPEDVVLVSSNDIIGNTNKISDSSDVIPETSSSKFADKTNKRLRCDIENSDETATLSKKRESSPSSSGVDSNYGGTNSIENLISDSTVRNVTTNSTGKRIDNKSDSFMVEEVKTKINDEKAISANLEKILVEALMSTKK